MLMRDYIMDEMKLFDADNSTATSLPLGDSRVAAGVRVGDQIMDYVRDDGWNSDGREGVVGLYPLTYSLQGAWFLQPLNLK